MEKFCRLKALGVKKNDPCKMDCENCRWFEPKEKIEEIKKQVHDMLLKEFEEKNNWHYSSNYTFTRG